MMKTARLSFLAVLAIGIAATVPASAGPISTQAGILKSAAADDVINVRTKRKWRDNGWYGGPRWHGPDTVGSLGYDGRGYAFNRFSGQVYYTCMEDLGYGRVRPCDAGRR
jgi:hypothetical protein